MYNDTQNHTQNETNASVNSLPYSLSCYGAFYLCKHVDIKRKSTKNTKLKTKKALYVYVKHKKQSIHYIWTINIKNLRTNIKHLRSPHYQKYQ
jgi:hypothetical protein